MGEYTHGVYSPRTVSVIEARILEKRSWSNELHSVYAVVAAVVLITGLATSTLTQSSILFSTRMVQQEGYLATAQVLERIPPDVPDVDRNEDFAACGLLHRL